MPGLDGINHETHYSKHPDLKYNQIFFVKGKIQVRASRPFSIGEEFLINYDSFDPVVKIFQTKGYI